MGAELCRNVPAPATPQNKPKNCLEVCHGMPTEDNIKNDEKVDPIEFSEVQSEWSPKKEEGGQTTITKNGTILRFQETHTRLESNSTESNMKQKIQRSMKFSELSQPKKRNTDLVLISKNKQGDIEYLTQKEDYCPVSVPFQVIKLIIRPGIAKQIKNYTKDFFVKHGHPSAQTYLSWKLLSNGCYLNKISDGTVMIVTEDKFYSGTTINQGLKPEGSGILITMSGTYKGNFKEGKSNGKGVFIAIDGAKRVDGYWKDGHLEKGKIETDQYKYEGNFKNNIPNGKGTLQILKKNIQYSGLFLNGLFEDEQGIYTCSKYIYKGGFSKGKKNGPGILHPNQKLGRRSVNNIKSLEVVFTNDKFERPKA